ncbi:MAG TPA: tRNA pseudouridine(55) synthase TruB [Polyangia bacterium]|jgi:tRNA pseudouridine55 synthase|nr:tRNA pseudouridine(55) synthase TruB [Polyangia bacterium]
MTSGAPAAHGAAELAGVLVVDKPAGPTSFDIVRQVRRALHIRRVGHGGTLDPMATGVLPICLGEATKLAQFLLDADKEYQATLCFGVETDTYDATGAVVESRGIAGLTPARVADALGAFRGSIRQVPPRFSALKLRGRPLYDYARAGEEVDPAARTVVIHDLSVVDWTGPDTLVLRVRCSKGTYIRSLAFDLGRAVGAGAHLAALCRTRSGPFHLADACTLAEIERAPLVGLSQALGHLPVLHADSAAVLQLRQGQRVARAALQPPQRGEPLPAEPSNTRFQVVRADGTLVAVADVDSSAGVDARLRTVRVFN